MDGKERSSAGRRGEAGSAYITTLLALVVLTILALALALVTQTEVQIGANEKTVSRSFYSADSGLGIAVSDALVSGRYVGRTVVLNVSDPVAGARTADRVRISPMVPLLRVRCDWCPSNHNGVPKFWSVHHGVTVTAERISWTGGETPAPEASLLGQKTLSVMYEIQPWPDPPVDSLRDTAALQQVRF
jgi:Tfp pilus assembly protein PilX